MRAFIGVRIKPDEKIKELLSEIKKEEGIKTVEEENLHINIKFLGEISETQAENVKSVLKRIRTGPFMITLKKISFFPNREFIRVIFISVESKELIALNEFIENKLYENGFMKEKKDYLPHLTLARVKKRLKEEVVDKLEKERIDKELKVKEVELIRSVLTKEKPVYETIFRVVL